MARLLIVDDDAFLVGIYATKLERAGHTVQVAQNARDAVHKAEVAPPDAVMLDVVLGAGNGLEVLAYLRQTPGCETIPIVMVSNQDDAGIIAEARRRGANGYIVKGYYTPSEVIANVMRVQ